MLHNSSGPVEVVAVSNEQGASKELVQIADFDELDRLDATLAESCRHRTKIV
jgi:hypothetical protein